VDFLERPEEILIILLQTIKDDNHAYSRGKACRTAIMKVEERLKHFREVAKRDPSIVYVLLIPTEDISSAYESIDHLTIQRYADHSVNAGGALGRVSSYCRISLDPPMSRTTRFLYIKTSTIGRPLKGATISAPLQSWTYQTVLRLPTRAKRLSKPYLNITCSIFFF
jgi:hypothetical protein